MSKILPYYRRCFYTHSKSTQTLSSRKCAGIVVMYEGLIYHETYNERWLYTRWRCQNFIPVEKGESAETSLESLCTSSWPIKDISELGLSTLFATRHAQIRLPSRPKSESWQSISKNTRLQIPLFTKMILENERDQSYFAGFSRKYVSPRVAFILHYWYFKGSWLLYLKVTGKEYFHDLGGCWGNKEWGSVKGMNLISATEPN